MGPPTVYTTPLPLYYGAPPLPYPPSTMTKCRGQKGGQSPKSSSTFLF